MADPLEPPISVAAMRVMPEKRYRLRNGTQGTEYEALLEVIRAWEEKRQEAEDMLEEYRKRLPTAEGHPPL